MNENGPVIYADCLEIRIGLTKELSLCIVPLRRSQVLRFFSSRFQPSFGQPDDLPQTASFTPAPAACWNTRDVAIERALGVTDPRGSSGDPPEYCAPVVFDERAKGKRIAGRGVIQNAGSRNDGVNPSAPVNGPKQTGKTCRM